MMSMGDPSQAPGAQPQPINAQEKEAITQLIQQVKARLSNFKAVNFAAQNKVEILRKQLLQQVFQKLQMAGVDLSSQASVAQFMAQLQQANPTLAAGFERAMSVLLGAPGSPIADAAPDPTVPPGADPTQTQNETPNQAVPQTP